MAQDAFKAELLAAGFAEPVIVRREANGSLDTHTHPFAAKALILEGEISIRVNDIETCYRPGSQFHLAANTPHAESYGPAGVVYLVGRK